MAEKKAVLNVTVAESVARAAREEASARNGTVSSVVEQALAAHLAAIRRREAGLAAIEEYYRDYERPTAAEMAAADARVAEDERLIAAARQQPQRRNEDDPAA